MASKTHRSKDSSCSHIVDQSKDLETLVGNAVKKHLDSFRLEIRSLIIDQLGGLEKRVTELEARVQSLEKDLDEKTEKLMQCESANDCIASLPKSDVIVLKPDLEAVKELARSGSIAANDCEQYSRRQNIRIRGLAIPKDENTTDVVTAWINSKLGMPNICSTDIGAAHPLFVGKLNGSDAAPLPTILVRFLRRDVRDSVISARKILKNSNVSISDDLTNLNAQLLKRLQNDTRLLGAWSWKGEIIAKLSETKNVVVKPYQSIDDLLLRA